MRRIIKDFNKLNPSQKGLLLEKYPNGISNTDLKSFTDHTGKKVRVLEFVTPDEILLIRFKPSVSDRHFEEDEDHEMHHFHEDPDDEASMKSSFL